MPWWSWSPPLCGARPLLPRGLPHRQGEVAETDSRLPTQDGISPESGKLLRREQHAAHGIKIEAAHGPSHATGKPQLAGGIKKNKSAFADTVALAARP